MTFIKYFTLYPDCLRFSIMCRCILLIAMAMILANCKSLEKVENNNTNSVIKNFENKSNIEKNEKNEKNEKIRNNTENDKLKNETTEKYEIDFIDFSVSINPSDSIRYSENLYLTVYELKFEFINKDFNFFIELTLRDNDGNILLENKKLTPTLNAFKNHSYLFYHKLTEKFTYSKLKYSIRAYNSDGYIKEYRGDYFIEKQPEIKNIEIGPFITSSINNKLVNSIAVNIEINNFNNIEWIRLIPPKRDSFWEIPWTADGVQAKASGAIIEKNSDSLENGAYILQINFLQLGIYQKEIIIRDLYGNDRGSMRGFPVAAEIESQKNAVKLDINLSSNLDYMELWLYEKTGESMRKAGISKFRSPSENISKNEIRDLLRDDYKNRVKINYSSEYYYQIVLYTYEFNGMKFVSISRYYPIKFYGIFNF